MNEKVVTVWTFSTKLFILYMPHLYEMSRKKKKDKFYVPKEEVDGDMGQ